MRLLMLAATTTALRCGLRVQRTRARRLATRLPDAPNLRLLDGSDELRRGLSADGFVSAKAVDVTRAVREISELQECLRRATALRRAIASVVLIADGLEADETFQVRFVGDGPLRGVFAVCNGALETRGYVGNPKVALSTGGVKSGVGAGQLQVVRLKNLPGEEELSPYSSVVEITSGEIAEDINYYAVAEHLLKNIQRVIDEKVTTTSVLKAGNTRRGRARASTGAVFVLFRPRG
ncbi:Hsp33-like molecular chaperone [Aureococcus anophagefferens]|uniref:Hsp33-like molecular chaperone n=1 Tax=Aureococcus anophagefferens TaxID=44056 RepID=A0ABR1FQ42_AURAN